MVLCLAACASSCSKCSENWTLDPKISKNYKFRERQMRMSDSFSCPSSTVADVSQQLPCGSLQLFGASWPMRRSLCGSFLRVCLQTFSLNTPQHDRFSCAVLEVQQQIWQGAPLKKFIVPTYWEKKQAPRPPTDRASAPAGGPQHNASLIQTLFLFYVS